MVASVGGILCSVIEALVLAVLDAKHDRRSRLANQVRLVLHTGAYWLLLKG
jgi:hypothetical protein